MITKNLKKIAAGILCASSSGYSFIPIVDISGETVYASMPYASNSSGRFFPGVGSIQAITGSVNAAGVRVGAGATQPTEDDYNLESQITTIAGTTLTNITFNCDNNDNPVVNIPVKVQNNGDGPITVREIGYAVSIRCGTSVGSSGSAHIILLDRTLLDTPVTIQAGETKVITYTLKGIWNTGA